MSDHVIVALVPEANYIFAPALSKLKQISWFLDSLDIKELFGEPSHYHRQSIHSMN